MQAKKLTFTAENVLSFLYAATIIIYLISVPFTTLLIQQIVLMLWAISFLFSVIKAELSYKIVGLSSLALSIVLSTASGDFYRLYCTGEVFNGVYLILPVIVLFYVVPLLAVPVQIGPYPSAIANILSTIKKGEITSRFSFIFMSYSVYLLSAITNVGAIATTSHSLQDSQAGFDKKTQKIIGIKTLSRGVPLVAMWTPISITGIIVVANVGGDWVAFVRVTILFSLFLLFVQTLLSFIEIPFTKVKLATYREKQYVGISFLHVATMLTIFIAYICFALYLSDLLDFPLTYFIGVLVIPTILIWSLCLKQAIPGLKILKSYTMNLHRQSNTICAFLPVGLFIYTVQNTEYIELFYQFFLWTQANLNLLGTIFFIGLLPLLFAQIGVFPILSAILLSQLIEPTVVNLRPEWLALLIAATSSASFIVTRFAMMTQLVGNLFNTSSTEVVRHNLLFVAIMYLSTCILVYLLQLSFP